MTTSASGQRIAGASRSVLVDAVARRYRSGERIRDIALDCGRSYGFVRTLLLEAGVPLRRRGADRADGPMVSVQTHPPGPPQMTEAARTALSGVVSARYLSGDTIAAIAADYGRSPNFVRALLVKAGVTRRQASPPRASIDRIARHRWADAPDELILYPGGIVGPSAAHLAPEPAGSTAIVRALSTMMATEPADALDRVSGAAG